MAETLGAIASVLTLCRAVAAGLGIARRMYNAPEEIQALQSQVEILSVVLSVLSDGAMGKPEDAAVVQALSLVEAALEELNTLMKTRLLAKGNDKEYRRVGWIRNKAKVSDLSDRIKDLRSTLQLATSTEVLQSTQRVEQLLGSLQLPLSSPPTHRQTAPAQLKRSRIVLPADVQAQIQVSVISRPPFSSVLPCDPRLHSSDEVSGGNAETVTVTTPTSSHQGTPPEQGSAQPVATCSTFELLDSFFPEKYILEARPCFSVRRAYQDTQTPQVYSRTCHFWISFSRSPREHLDVSISLVANVESPYYHLAGLFPPLSPYQRSVWARNRGPIFSLLETYLDANREQLQQHSQLDIFLGATQNGATTRPLKALESTEQQLKAATKKLHHMSVPWFFESSLTFFRPSVRMYMNEVAQVGSRRARVRWFTSNHTDNDGLLYITRALHILRNTPGVLKLVGTVKDPVTGTVKGVLIDLPAHGQLLGVLSEFGNAVKWDRRAKWCRQAVEVVAAAHASELVIGILGDHNKDGIGLDYNDNLVIYNFQSRLFLPGTTAGPWSNITGVPPECLSESTSERVCWANATLESDVYQLGLLLLRISLAGSDNGPSASLHAPQESYVSQGELQLPASLPPYLREVITACRDPSPSTRPSAWELLAKFPTEESSTSSGAEGGWSHDDQSLANTDFERVWNDEVNCDRCDRPMSEDFYTCGVCIGGDFDLCSDCFDKGAHCLDGHFMQRCQRRRQQHVEVEDGMLDAAKQNESPDGKFRYYGPVRAEGGRQILVF